MPGITISREYGAGASVIAQELSRVLGYTILGSQLISQVADLLSVEEEVVAARDERPEGLFERIARNLRGATPEGVSVGPAADPDDRQIADALEAIVSEAARLEPLIILGHGAQVTLARDPEYIHTRLVAPLEVRVQRIAEMLGLSRSEAEHRVAEKDDERRRWTRRCWNIDIDDPHQYDVCVDTSRLGVMRTAGVLLYAYRSMR